MVGDLAAVPLRLKNLLEPPIEALGYELVHIEFAGDENRAGSQVLRVYIDAPGGIQVNDCASVSRQLSAVLEVEEAAIANYVPARYSLEVSSPGINRPLVKPAHFARFVGHRAKIVLNSARGERRKFTGELKEVDARRVVLEVDGECYELSHDDIDTARLAPKF